MVNKILIIAPESGGACFVGAGYEIWAPGADIYDSRQAEMSAHR
jgi:hypothetical protein